MRRGRWAALLLVCLAVLAGTTTDTEPDTEPSGRSGTTKLLRVPHLLEVWRPPDLLGEGWRVLPPKSPAGEAVRAQGGLWRLDVPHDAGGELRTVPGSEPAPREAERVVTVRVAVERGLAVNGTEFARQVMDTLNDPRGWGHDGSVVFARTDGEADIDITLASPATTDELCAPVDTAGRVSCGRVGYAVLNAQRWAHGAEPFLEAGGTVADYRHYLVNHEVGHVLGHPHVRCPASGALAPVMVQQTLGLDGCRPNGWPAASG